MIIFLSLNERTILWGPFYSSSHLLFTVFRVGDKNDGSKPNDYHPITQFTCTRTRKAAINTSREEKLGAYL